MVPTRTNKLAIAIDRISFIPIVGVGDAVRSDPLRPSLFGAARTRRRIPLLLADPFLRRFGPCLGLVAPRQTFVRRCQNYVVIHQGRGRGMGQQPAGAGPYARRASGDGGQVGRPPIQAQALKRITGELPVPRHKTPNGRSAAAASLISRNGISASRCCSSNRLRHCHAQSRATNRPSPFQQSPCRHGASAQGFCHWV
jgi:hypothetical protein